MATQTAVDVVMPQMGVSVSEGTITKWLKQPGDTVEADEALLEISTDKVDTEVPSPASGVVQKILSQEGETVAVGETIAVIGPEGAEVESAEAPAEAPPEPATAAAAEEAEGVSSAEGETASATTTEAEPAADDSASTEPDVVATSTVAPSPWVIALAGSGLEARVPRGGFDGPDPSSFAPLQGDPAQLTRVNFRLRW